MGYTYDPGALIAAERGDVTIWIMHNDMVSAGVRPVVSAGVLAQVWRGGSDRQAGLAQMLRHCRVESLEVGLAKQVGVALQKARTSDVVDASVVVSAIGRGDTVVTSDPQDIQETLDALGEQVKVFTV